MILYERRKQNNSYQAAKSLVLHVLDIRVLSANSQIY